MTDHTTMLDLRDDIRSLRNSDDCYAGIYDHTPLNDSSLEQMIQRTWLGRMVNEYGSSTVFSQFAAQCRIHSSDNSSDFRISPETLDRLEEFAAEEHRHGILCGMVGEAFGGQAVAPPLPHTLFPLHEDCSPIEGILRNLLSICCLSETVAVALIAAEREDMPEGTLKDLLTEIWSDECGHAHFGWRKLQEWLPNDPDLKERLGEYLTVAFGHLETHELKHLPLSSTPPTEGAQFGLCNGREARALFYATVEGIIVPNLEALGIPAQWAWTNRVGTA